ncbi:hypothetical protein ACIP6Q_27795 [Streptomyces bobili]|uniref:hypothetical protein n=1 Tax=Streptomyces bobili TaxID=67280 RepID=UPI0037FD0E7B
MPRLSCHFPITVSVSGEPSAAALEQLGRVVEQALAARLRLAHQHLQTVTGRAPAAPVEAREAMDQGRIGPTGRVYRVPSYDGGGALKSVRLETAAPQPRDPAILSDTELEAEYEHTRDWLLGHQRVEAAYAASKAYADALEAELRRRALTMTAPTGRAAAAPSSGPKASVTGPPHGTRVAPPFGMGTAPPHDEPVRVTASAAGGAYGEHDLPFLLGRRGVHAVITASGSGAHRLNGRGFDYVGLHPESDELWLVDNKSSYAVANADGTKATALGKNLQGSCEEAIGKIRPMPDFPEKATVLRRLEGALAAVKAGKPIPAELKVKLKVTNAGGYVSGARNLPPGVEFMDVVGHEIRAARAVEIAKAEKAGVSPSRPRSHKDTEAMRRRVGGAMSRQPVRVTPGVRIARGARAAGLTLVTIALTLIWNAVMSRIDQAIEKWYLERWAQPRLRALEPAIAARLDDRIEELVDLQLRHPGKPLYGVVGILTTLHRGGEDDTELESVEIALTSVSVAAERVERTDVEFVRTGYWYWVRDVRDLIRTTYSVELEPLGKAELVAVLQDRIASEEEAAGSRSAPPEQELASQRRRDELVAHLTRLEQAP